MQEARGGCRDKLPLRDPDYRRFPAAAILDLVAVYHDRATLDWDSRVCDHLVSPIFERQAAPISDNHAGDAIQRRVLGTTASGRVP